MKGLFVVCLLVAAVYCQVGGTRGPCSAVAIPGPFSEPISLFGSNTASTATAIDCNSDDLDGPTTWYSITPASGTQVTITTCSSYTNFDTILVVYSGNCESLSCVTLGDDSDSCQVNYNYAQTQFVSSGEEYFVAVTGYSGVTGYLGATGQFELTFSEVAVNASATCQTAIAVPGPYITPVTIYGDNSHSGGYSPSTCGLSSTSHIDWYILTPQAGSQVQVSTCNAVTNFDTQLAILSGSCTSLSCIATNDDNCTTYGVASGLSFTASPNIVQYYLAVFGYGSASGTYEVRIIEHPVQSTLGGDCGTAIEIAFSPSTTSYYFGNTENSLTSTVSACTSIYSKSVWYRIDVPGNYYGSISVSTCDQGTDFDTLIAIYSGNCAGLRCITFNDDNCSIYSYASTVSWTVTHSTAEVLLEDLASGTPSRTPSISGTSSATSSGSGTPSSTPSMSGTSSRSPSSSNSRSAGSSRSVTGTSMSSVSPGSSRSSTPTRTPTAATGTTTYFIQVAGYGSNYGSYVLSVRAQ